MTTFTLPTVPGHVQYGDALLLGPGTPYHVRTLSGWEELPALDSGTVPRPAAHGAYPGALLAQPRTITVDDMVIRAPADQIGAALDRLNVGTGVTDEELPLLIHLDERGPLLAFARVVRRVVPVESGYALGVITGAAIQWEASDPRRYLPPEQCAETGLPEPCLDWHRDDAGAFTRGVPASTGTLAPYNAGTAPTHPVITFRGPVDTPTLTNSTTGAQLSYRVQLDDGEELTVDTYASTVTLNGTDNLIGTAAATSHPEHVFTLPPGYSSLAFSADPSRPPDKRAAAVLRWRSAYW
jgi:hypothetical protein